MIRFHNTLSGKVEAFEPIEPGSVRLYTCGPTVYDFPHIGNWRAYIFEDLLKRFLLFSGYKVTHVMNLTDVDDKTIRGAGAKGVSLEEYTRPFIEAFKKDLETLNILPADHYPRATGHIQEMVDIIKVLLEKGFAYRKDGSIYFAIAKFPAYGRLSKVNLEDLRPGSRGDADEYEKESVHDFALWKAPKEGEPSWDEGIGPGRPGWHIECSAMSSKYLGRTFDIHCGGVDNIFPHHENEIAQSEAANGVKFVNFWLHCHHLVVDGEKMAKSKGNFYTLEDILAKGYDPREVRFLLLSTHYRKMLNFTFEALDQARAGRSRIRDFLVDLRGVKREGPPSPEVNGLIEAARSGFITGLGDDLNISESLAALFSLIEKANSLMAKSRISQADALSLISFVTEIDKKILMIEPTSVILRVDSAKIQGTAENVQIKVDVSSELDSAIQEKIDERQKARAEKNFKRADEIRKELLSQGILLEDTKDDVRWKKIVLPRT
ncbi:MAG: cysteine--tRNA ligase [Candidatus Aminicenantes bacterium]|nr:cysteine--tRNA ligase [Candidatus Aminicenantes bacterium]